MFTIFYTKSVVLCGAQWRRALGRSILGTRVLAAATLVAIIAPFAAAPGTAQSDPTGGFAGVWYDDTGDGAIELAACGDRLCGRIVWLKNGNDDRGRPLTDGNNSDAAKSKRPICGLPVIGDVKRQRDGTWDAGWVYDPKEGKQYDVALQLNTPAELKVTGYLGVKLLSESFIWKRAPVDIKRCDVASRR